MIERFIPQLISMNQLRIHLLIYKIQLSNEMFDSIRARLQCSMPRFYVRKHLPGIMVR